MGIWSVQSCWSITEQVGPIVTIQVNVVLITDHDYAVNAFLRIYLGMSALHWAVDGGHEGIVHYALNEGVKVGIDHMFVCMEESACAISIGK